MTAKEKKIFAQANELALELGERVIKGEIDPNAIAIGCTHLGVKTMVGSGMNDKEIIETLCSVMKAERALHDQYKEWRGKT